MNILALINRNFQEDGGRRVESILDEKLCIIKHRMTTIVQFTLNLLIVQLNVLAADLLSHRLTLALKACYTVSGSGDFASPDYFDHDNGFNMVADHFSGDIDKNRLKVQLSMLASSLSKKDAHVTIDDVVAQVRSLGKAKKMFTEVCKLLRLLLTIPVSSATAKRSFSALRRLKTDTRSTMTVALMHVHQDRTDNVNDELTMRSSVSGVDLRKETFGKFRVSDASHLP